jgi:ribonucleotide reductase beta subunit family protein with ferritin-like domain
VINNDEDIHQLYKKAEKSFWVFEELLTELDKDAAFWPKLSADQQFFIKNILAFFAVSDFYVNETITEQIKTRVKYLPWHRWEDFKLMMENTHNMTYGKLVEAYIKDKKERMEILDAVRFNPSIQSKIDWMHKWVGKSNEMAHLEKSKQLAIRDLYNSFITNKVRSLEQLGMIKSDSSEDHINEILNKYIPENIQALRDELMEEKSSLALVVLINAITEGVFFSGSFCAIFWFKRNGNKLPGLSAANDLISRDEGMHCIFAIMIYRYKLIHQLPQKLVHEIMREAVSIEKNFICNALPHDMLGMNAELMGRYIEFVADQQLCNLGYERIWTRSVEDNPFKWMESQSIGIQIADFFKKTPNQYGHHASNLTVEELAPAFDEDF